MSLPLDRSAPALSLDMSLLRGPCLHQKLLAAPGDSGRTQFCRGSRQAAKHRSQVQVFAVAEVNHVVQDTPAQTRRLSEVLKGSSHGQALLPFRQGLTPSAVMQPDVPVGTPVVPPQVLWLADADPWAGKAELQRLTCCVRLRTFLPDRVGTGGVPPSGMLCQRPSSTLHT